MANGFDAVREIERISREWGQGLSRELTGVLTQMRRGVADAMETGLQAGLSQGRSNRALNDWVNSGIGDLAERMERALQTASRAEMLGYQNTARTYQQRAQAMMAQMEQQTAQWHKEIDLQDKAWRRINAERSRTMEDDMQTMERGADKAAGILSGALSGDIGGLAQRGIGGLRGKARGLQEKSRFFEKEARLAGMGGDTKKQAAMAKQAANLGKLAGAAGALAAVAVVVAALIKAFIELDSKIVDMNRSLLDSAGAADFGLGHGDAMVGRLRTRIAELRDATTGLNEQWTKFGATTREQQALLATLNRAGFTYAKMTEGLTTAEERAEGYGDAMNQVLTYSRLLGVSSAEMADKMGQFTLQTGLDLDQVAMGFSTIQKEALAAGFATKRFYAAISEAASNMAYYGMRIEETTLLMSQMGKMIGQVGAEDVMREVAGRMGKSYTENLKTILVKGGGFATEVFEDEYKLRMEAMRKEVGSEQARQIQAALESAASPQEFGQALQRMGIQGAQLQQLRQLKTFQLAAQGQQTAQVAAMGRAGPATQLIMALKSAIPLEGFGDNIGDAFSTAVAENNMGVLAALDNLEQSTGKSRDELIDLASTASEQYSELERLRASNQAIPEYLKPVEDAQGWEDIFRHTLESSEDTREQMTRDQEIASRIADNTKKLSEAIDQTVVGWLNSIYSVLNDFYRAALSKWDMEGAALATYQERQLDEAQAARNKLDDLYAQQAEITKKADQGQPLSAEDKQKLDELNKAILDQTKQAEIAANEARLAQKVTVEDFSDNAAREQARVAAEARGKTGEDLAKAIAEGEKIGAQYQAPSKFEQYTAKTMDLTAATNPMMWPVVFGSAMGDAIVDKIEGAYIGEFGTEEEKAARTELEAAKSERGWAEWAADVLMPNATRVQDKLDEQILVQEKMVEKLGEESPGDWASAFLSQAQDASDLLIPSQGRPIVLDSEDDVLAMKRGGAVDRAAGGGGRMTVNVYGGNQREVYNTVVKAAKAMGIA